MAAMRLCLLRNAPRADRYTRLRWCCQGRACRHCFCIFQTRCRNPNRPRRLNGKQEGFGPTCAAPATVRMDSSSQAATEALKALGRRDARRCVCTTHRLHAQPGYRPTRALPQRPRLASFHGRFERWLVLAGWRCKAQQPVVATTASFPRTACSVGCRSRL